MKCLHARKPGTTLVELLIFIALLGIVIGAILPLLFMAAEDRLLQQTISVVEQNGAQVLQNASQRIRNAERILSPAMGQTGSLLVMQTASGGTNPTIIGFLSGAVLIIEGTLQQTISSSQVAVTDFLVRNTSTSATRQSAEISFSIIRTTRLSQPHYYLRSFTMAVSLLPADLPNNSNAACAAPFCAPSNTYNWQLYDKLTGTCLEASTPLRCP
jgi:type II secretory pathway pseudopilin PulG